MRICVVGAGAIGGYLAVRLANAGNTVSVIARGPHLAAIRDHGLRLRIGETLESAQVRASEDPADLGPQDYVVITLKSHGLPGMAPRLAPLMTADTTILTAMNGVPYWYFQTLGGPWSGRIIDAVDPGGVVSAALAPDRALGCVVHCACEVEAPGVIRHGSGDTFILGEPDGSVSERVTRLSKALTVAGFNAPVHPKIQDEIWLKLWGNLSFNPISALTGGTLEQICADEDTRALARRIMVEGQAVGEALGAHFRIELDKRIEMAANVGPHKTSMLQDLELGRPLEIDGIVTAVQQMGRLTGIETPTIDMVLALVRQRARLAGCYP